MLLKKKVFHLNYYVKKNINLYYKLLGNKILNSFVSLHFYFFFKKKIKVCYNYYIRIKIPNLTIFNSILAIFFNLSKNIHGIKLYFNVIKKLKKYYTVLRSPFVYKSSQEHYLLENFIGIIHISLKYTNFFFINYFEFFIKKTLIC